MSAILSKTFEQTVSILKGNRLLWSESEANLIRLEEWLANSGTKKERKSIVEECKASLKERTQDTRLTLTERRECLLIIMHLTSLVEKVDSIEPFVIKSIEDANTYFDKCLGYSVLDLVHQTFRSSGYLAVNTLLKDISSRHNSVVCLSLKACTFLMDIDLIPVFLPSIEKLLKSSSVKVKCQAMYVLHRMLQIGPEYLINIWDTTVKALCDKSPHIMSSSLPVLLSLLQVSDPPLELKIPKKVIFILKQVEQGCLPIDMMYGGVSGPWIQMRLIKIIRTLSKAVFCELDFKELADIFRNIFERMQASSTVQYAIIVECIETIVLFHPHLEKVETIALDMLEKFLTSKNINLLLSGVELLKSLIKIKPGHSKQHASVLLNCLSGKNSVLIKLSLSIIRDLVSEENSEYIIKTMLDKLKTVPSTGLKKKCLISLLAILEKYPMKNEWLLENYLSIMGYLENEIDESIIKSMLQCLRAVNRDSVCKEAHRIASSMKSLNNKFTALQYCMMLEVLLWYDDNLTQAQCEVLLQDILANCTAKKWAGDKNADRITLRSWDVYLNLAIRHEIPGLESFSCQNIDLKTSLPVRQKFDETKWLLGNSKLGKEVGMTNPDEIFDLEFDASLTFLDEYVESTDASLEVETEENVPPTVVKKGESPKLKFKPYSKSRFDRHDIDPLPEPTTPKKVFLGETHAPRNVKQVWDKSNYQLESSASDVEPNAQ